jgi:hypothetical protein
MPCVRLFLYDEDKRKQMKKTKENEKDIEKKEKLHKQKEEQRQIDKEE